MSDKRTFPMLGASATNFPHTDTADTDTGQTFDYSLWVSGARIRVLSVPWDNPADGGTINLPEFQTTAGRAAWIDRQTTHVYTLETSMHVGITDSVKLPIPFDEVATCNYAVVDYPASPVGMGGNRVSQFCYFVNALDYVAPSTTRLSLALDLWTTYRPSCRISSVMMERGHLIMSHAPTVEEYLDDPHTHREWLMASEPNSPAAAPQTTRTSSVYLSVSTGERSVIFATTAPASAWNVSTVPPEQPTGGEPTYADSSDRFGKQYTVTGYGIHPTTGKDFTGYGGTFNTTIHTPDNLTYGPTMLSVPESDAQSFFDDLQTAQPQLFKSITYAAVIPTKWAGFDTTHIVTCCGHKLTPVTAKITDAVRGLRPVESSFGYPEEVKDFTKLYTAPYAMWEISDDNGHSVNVRIEDAGKSTDCVIRFAAVLPYIDLTAFFAGIGTETETAQIITATQNGRTLVWYQTDPTEFAFTAGIPTFSLGLSSEAIASYEQAGTWQQQTKKALDAYHAALRSSNTGTENTIDSATISKTQANRVAAMARNNVTSSNDTQTANTTIATTLATEMTNLQNTLASNITSESNTMGQTINGDVDDTHPDIPEGSNLWRLAADYRADAEYQESIRRVQTQENIDNVGLAALGTAVQGVQEAATEDVAGAVKTAVGVVTSALQYQAMLTKSQGLSDASRTLMYTKFDNARKASTYTAQHQRLLATKQTTITNGSRTATTTKQNTAATQTNTNNVNLATTMADRALATSQTNAQETYSLTTANAVHSRDDAAIWTAQRTLENTRLDALAAYNQTATRSQPIPIGTTAGDWNGIEWGYAIHTRIKTQPTGVIMQAATDFALHGYTLRRQISCDNDLAPYAHRNYIMASDAWGDHHLCPARAWQLIKTLLAAGVTLWRHPDDITTATDIFDNPRR